MEYSLWQRRCTKDGLFLAGIELGNIRQILP